MKQILSLFAIGLVFTCISCNSDKTEKTAGETTSADKKDNSMTEKNLASSHIVDKAFETGDPSAIDSAVASDFVDHTDKGDMNRDSLKAMIVNMHKEFPDMKMEKIKELADNDYVFDLMRYTGTSKGQMGMPVGPYDMKVIEVVRFKDGKGVEHWSYMQPSDMMKMMAPATGKMDDKMKKK
ncbi:MAG: ester cyclase [Bacteroidota bacterium]|nr:ester cyclase [Bacteroidota bacterium]